MFVRTINSRKYKKTFYKVVFEGIEELEEYKNSLEWFKQKFIDGKDLADDDASIELYDMLSSAFEKVEESENGEYCMVLYDVGALLCNFFSLMRLSELDNVIKQKQKELLSVYEENEEIMKQTISLLKERVAETKDLNIIDKI